MSFIPVNEPVLSGNEKRYLAECIETGWISSEGPFITQLETGLAQRVGRKHGIAVCNGSVALDVALTALKIGPGDEVILPSFTIISCAAAIVRCGATPIAVDADPNNWNLQTGLIERLITARTKAIMVVHLYGLPVDMNPVMQIANRHELRVIEDFAEVIGQTYHGRPCGSFGDISATSFYPNKHITTGEGGMVLADDEQLASHCRNLRNLCFGKTRRFVHEELGWNFRMSNLQAAVGVAQLEKLDRTLQRKRQIGALYRRELQGVKGIKLPVATSNGAENLYWVFGVVLDDEVPFDADGAMQRLHDLGIGTRPFFWPMHRQPVFLKMGLFAEANCPVSERLGERGFYLPSGLAITDDQIVLAAAALKRILA